MFSVGSSGVKTGSLRTEKGIYLVWQANGTEANSSNVTFRQLWLTPTAKFEKSNIPERLCSQTSWKSWSGSLGQEKWNLAVRVRACAKLRRSCTQQQQQRHFRHNRRQIAFKVAFWGFWYFGTGRNLSNRFPIFSLARGSRLLRRKRRRRLLKKGIGTVAPLLLTWAVASVEPWAVQFLREKTRPRFSNAQR